tara:strand:- start:1556 stop:1927 length:372 start_codon:yes stop_codon:yes gene_type:complete
VTTGTKSLAEIRHLLVIAAQKEYDDRIKAGLHPYTMASYHFNDCISEELKKHVDTSGWKSGNWTSIQTATGFYEYEVVLDKYGQNEGPLSNGLWAVGAYLRSKAAYATPGFAEAYRNHCMENN